MKVIIAKNDFILDHRRVMYDVKREEIIVADLHVGKSAHFRKAGISLPGYSFVSDILRFQQILYDYQPKSVLILGDLFHSDKNEEFNEWNELVKSFPEIKFVLVIGNHDLWSMRSTDLEGLDAVNELQRENVFYSHEPTDKADCINFCGHIHPGVKLKGSGKQELSLSCFWLAKNRLVLPAFSELTGLGMVKPKKTDRIYIPVEDKVIEI